VIRDYGEERFAKQIAAAIVAARRSEPIVRTRQLADLVGQTVRTREPGQDPATRTFQALRIHLNRELEEVALMLPQAAARLAPGGRLAVISFHSLEDRIVKRFMQDAARPQLPRELPLKASEMPQPVLRLVGRAQRASPDETRRNPRARSATLRVAERTAVPFPQTNSRIEPGARWRN
jgi:16S rRNA (cytosine1402-N4)-methyltransferase